MLAASVLCAVALAPQSSSIEVPFRIAEDAMIVDAVVNGRKASLMFDTGFSGAVVMSDSIDLGPASGKMTLRDFVGTFEAKTVKVRTLSLGAKKIDASDMEAVQQPLRAMSMGYNAHTDGIMGLQVIAPYITEINFQNSKFIFHPKTVDITKRVPDNKRTFLAKLLPIGNTTLEMEVVASTGRKMVMGLDTGNAFFATTHKDVLERVGLWKAGRKPEFIKLSGVASGVVESWYFGMPKTTIFGVPVDSSVWSVIDLPASSAEGDGTIGFGFLKNFNITIDLEKRRVWLENFSGSFGNDAVGEVGISGGFREQERAVTVWRVTPGSPAHKAGIKERDTILSIDGEDLHSTSFRRLQSILEGDPGSKVKIAVSRQGQLLRFELERAKLVNPFAPSSG